MAKITLNSIANAKTDYVLINTNFQEIADHLNDLVLYRDNPMGEANQTSNDVDLNSNDILNAGTVNADNITVNGTSLETQVLAAEASATAAAVSETNAASSASTSSSSAAASAASAVEAQAGEDAVQAIIDSYNVDRTPLIIWEGSSARVTTGSINGYGVMGFTANDFTPGVYTFHKGVTGSSDIRLYEFPTTGTYTYATSFRDGNLMVQAGFFVQQPLFTGFKLTSYNIFNDATAEETITKIEFTPL